MDVAVDPAIERVDPVGLVDAVAVEVAGRELEGRAVHIVVDEGVAAFPEVDVAEGVGEDHLVVAAVVVDVARGHLVDAAAADAGEREVAAGVLADDAQVVARPLVPGLVDADELGAGVAGIELAKGDAVGQRHGVVDGPDIARVQAPEVHVADGVHDVDDAAVGAIEVGRGDVGDGAAAVAGDGGEVVAPQGAAVHAAVHEDDLVAAAVDVAGDDLVGVGAGDGDLGGSEAGPHADVARRVGEGDAEVAGRHAVVGVLPRGARVGEQGRPAAHVGPVLRRVVDLELIDEARELEARVADRAVADAEGVGAWRHRLVGRCRDDVAILPELDAVARAAGHGHVVPLVQRHVARDGAVDDLVAVEEEVLAVVGVAEGPVPLVRAVEPLGREAIPLPGVGRVGPHVGLDGPARGQVEVVGVRGLEHGRLPGVAAHLHRAPHDPRPVGDRQGPARRRPCQVVGRAASRRGVEQAALEAVLRDDRGTRRRRQHRAQQRRDHRRTRHHPLRVTHGLLLLEWLSVRHGLIARISPFLWWTGKPRAAGCPDCVSPQVFCLQELTGSPRAALRSPLRPPC